MLINICNSDISDLLDHEELLTIAMSFNNIEATAMLITIVNQTRVKNPDIFNKLFTLYIKSKLT